MTFFKFAGAVKSKTEGSLRVVRNPPLIACIRHMGPCVRSPMKRVYVLLLVFSCFLPAFMRGADELSLNPPAIYALWTGEWKGVLEYRDYQPPHGRVRLPTILSVTAANSSPALMLHFVYDDGPNKTVKSASRLTLDPAARTLTWVEDGKPATAEDTFTLAEASASGDRLVFCGEAMDDNKPARVRLTFTTAPGEWRILKETTSDGPTFAFRHEYRFTR